jgi:hypothetical protein
MIIALMLITISKSANINSVHIYYILMSALKLKGKFENPLPKQWNRCNHVNVSMAKGLAVSGLMRLLPVKNLKRII